MKEERTKSFDISKQELELSFVQVQSNRGTYGVDKESIAMFAEHLEGNLYKIWNRMSSGSYMPPTVRQVLIDKKQGGTRPLGIPTVGDRVAQGVIKHRFEQILEPKFHPSSYGYRPGKSAHDAIASCQHNCRYNDWVIDLDIKGFFDNLSHDWMLQMVKHHTQEKSTILYVQRWLTASVELQDGSIEQRTKGTPQGGVISPLLANLYLHEVFDLWMANYYSSNPFERYADDIVIHCQSKAEAVSLLELVKARLLKFGLEVHPEKTKIVYCKDDIRKGNHENESFSFLSYSFQPRVLKTKATKQFFTKFLPAISQSAKAFVRSKISAVFNPRWTDATIEQIAQVLNPKIRGWCNYYTKFMPREMFCIYEYLDARLRRWITNKYRVGIHKSVAMLEQIKRETNNGLFYHWRYKPAIVKH